MMRTLAGLLALVIGGNGAVMLVAGRWWYAAVPGVTTTGPYNAHFVKDIGAAYLVAGLGLAWFAARPRQGWPALVASAAFLGLHALIHLADAAQSRTGLADLLRDAPGVIAPALIAAAIAALSASTQGASHA
jgi:hypothetical protein